jgi:hypothetical protein
MISVAAGSDTQTHSSPRARNPVFLYESHSLDGTEITIETLALQALAYAPLLARLFITSPCSQMFIVALSLVSPV